MAWLLVVRGGSVQSRELSATRGIARFIVRRTPTGYACAGDLAFGGHIQEICISPPLSGLCALLAWSGVCVPGWAAGPRDESKPDPRPLGRAGARPDGCEVCLSKTFYKRLSGGVFLPRGAYFVYRAVLSQLQTTRGTRYTRTRTTPARVVRQSANHRGTCCTTDVTTDVPTTGRRACPG